MIDLTALAAALTTLRTTYAVTPSVAGATQAQLQTLLTAVVGAESAALAASQAADLVLAGSVGVGGVIAAGDPAAMTAAFTAYSDVAIQAPDLDDMVHFLSRMATNIEIATSGTQVNLS